MPTMPMHPVAAPSLALAFALALAALCAAAQATPLEVTVSDRDGKPAADVVVLVNTATSAALKPAPAPVVIAQEGLKFVPFLTVVPVGSTLRFVNRDAYDHHVRSTPSGPLGNAPSVQSFEFRLDASLAAPAQRGFNDDYATPAATAKKKSGASSADLRLEHAGAIGLGCHLHASMRGQVYVSASPWFGKTDANGVAVIDGVPEGEADVTLWHPDQLQDQTALTVKVGTTPAKAAAQLNFTPRRRRG
jgi:plastocyanin